MVKIPEDFIAPIRQIVDWYSEAYMHDEYNKVYLKRISSDLYNRIDGEIQIEEKFLHQIQESISHAINNVSECSVKKDTLVAIQHWMVSQPKL